MRNSSSLIALTCFLSGTLVLSQVTATALAADAPPAGLVGYWRLDEGVGTTAFDYSGKGAHGTVVGGAEWVTGESGPELRLDGKTGYVSVPDGGWNVGSPVTYCCWHKATKEGRVFDHEMGGRIPGVFSLQSGGRFAGYDGHPTDTSFSLGASKAPWTFVAITITPTTITAYRDGLPVATKAIEGMPRHPGPLAIGARGCVPDSFLEGSVREMAVFDRVLPADEIAAIHARSRKGQPLYEPARGLKLLAVRSERSLHKPLESAAVEVVVKNFSAAPEKAELAVGCVGRLADWKESSRQTLTLEPRQSRSLRVEVPLASQSFGTAVEARLFRDGKLFDRAEDFVGVHDNPWMVGIGGTLPGDFIGRAKPEQAEKLLELAREKYANWLEVFFWAPDDWGNLTPTADRWYSGQASYLMEPGKLKRFIESAHARGIKVVTYGKHVACGPDGAELMRRRPEWFRGGWGDVRQLDEWNDDAARAKKGAVFSWQQFPIDFNRPDALAYGIRQIADSAAMFGWDGVRFDGHYTVSSDAVSTWNIRQLKETLWAKRPDFLLGYNYAFAPDSYPVITREMREAMAGSGMWMQEAIGQHDGYSIDGSVYRTWTKAEGVARAFAPNELKQAKHVSSLGGQYHCILGLKPSPVGVYKLVYSLIAGAHSVYGSHEKVPGCDNWGRFMTRWSAFLWHPRLNIVERPEERITVGDSHVYWQPLAQELIDTPTRKFTVVHLVNPSPDDSLAKTTLPEPLGGFPVSIKASPGATIERVAFVRPDVEPYDVALANDGNAKEARVRVPGLAVWGMLIVEESGRFTEPQSPSRFSDPVSEADLVAGRSAPPGAIMVDPLQPPTVGVTLADDESLVETDTGYNSLNANGVSDPDAANGRAQARVSGAVRGSFGRTWNGPFPPGRYRIRARLKLVDTQTPPRRQSVRIDSSGVFYGTSTKFPPVDFNTDAATPPERRLVVDGTYHYYDREIELRSESLVHVFISGESKEPEGNSLFCDHLIVKQLEPYSDDKLFAMAPPPEKPAGLRTPEGRSPQKILQVRGLHWKPYGVEGLLPGCTSGYALPEKYEELYAYDAVVLANAVPQVKLEVRKMLEDFVKDGGRLVILGGPWTLDQARLSGTLLEPMLPFTIDGSNRKPPLVHCEPAVLLGPKANESWSDKPAVFWRHDLKARPKAEVVAYAGSDPVAATLAVGKGEVAVFAGTVLGEPAAGQTAFWESGSWPELVRRLAAVSRRP